MWLKALDPSSKNFDPIRVPLYSISALIGGLLFKLCTDEDGSTLYNAFLLGAFVAGSLAWNVGLYSWAKRNERLYRHKQGKAI